MAFRLAALFLVFALFSACDKTISMQPDAEDGDLQSAKVEGDFGSLAVGDSIELSAAFTTSGPIDTSRLQFSWKLGASDTVLERISESDITKLIPKEPGKYTLYLEISYGGKTVSTLIIFVVTEKIVYVDSNRSAQLKLYQEKLPGAYIGTVTTEWIPPYEIAMVFRADGGYSAYTTDASDYPALYYGMDEDAPRKTWKLEDVTASGNAVGKLNIVFNVGTEVEDRIESMHFDPDYAGLQFSLHHFDGPAMKVSLRRIDPDSLPPRK